MRRLKRTEGGRIFSRGATHSTGSSHGLRTKFATKSKRGWVLMEILPQLSNRCISGMLRLKSGGGGATPFSESDARSGSARATKFSTWYSKHAVSGSTSYSWRSC